MVRIVRENQDKLARHFLRELSRGHDKVFSVRAATDAKLQNVFHGQFLSVSASISATMALTMMARII